MLATVRVVHRYSPWLLIPVVGLLLFRSPWMSLGLIAVLVLCACRWIVTGSPVPATCVNPAILILLAMTTIGFVITSAPDLAVLTAGQIVASVAVFFIVVERIRTAADLWRVAAVIVLLGLASALAAPLTLPRTPNKVFDLASVYHEQWPRLDEVNNPNILAGTLALVVPLALALIASGRKRMQLVGAICLVPVSSMLVLLQSRGAWLGSACGLGMWIAGYRRWFLPLLPVVLAGAIVLNGVLDGPPPAQFLYGPTGIASIGTFVQRQDMWVQSLYLLRASPLVGIGLGAYPPVAAQWWPYSPTHPGPIQNHTHNLFLQIGLDTGVVGLAAFVALLVMAARLALAGYRANIERPLAIGTLASLTVLVVHGMGDVVVWGTAKPSVLCWMLLGLMVGWEHLQSDGTNVAQTGR